MAKSDRAGLRSPSALWSQLALGANLVAVAPEWRYDRSMPSVQVKDVPEEVHSVLRRRAAAAGQSLQEYLLARLRRDAETPTVEELFQRIEHHTGGEASLADTTSAVAEDRDSR